MNYKKQNKKMSFFFQTNKFTTKTKLYNVVSYKF